MLEIDQDDAFDYTNCSPAKFDKKKYLEIIWNHAQAFKLRKNASK